MHCLEVIIIRNAEAAGRECAHLDRDRNEEMSECNWRDSIGDNDEAFRRGYERGRQEG